MQLVNLRQPEHVRSVSESQIELWRMWEGSWQNEAEGGGGRGLFACGKSSHGSLPFETVVVVGLAVLDFNGVVEVGSDM